jgi:hypothetical protein
MLSLRCLHPRLIAKAVKGKAKKGPWVAMARTVATTARAAETAARAAATMATVARPRRGARSEPRSLYADDDRRAQCHGVSRDRSTLDADDRRSRKPMESLRARIDKEITADSFCVLAYLVGSQHCGQYYSSLFELFLVFPSLLFGPSPTATNPRALRFCLTILSYNAPRKEPEL